jgi:tetratricopeptide (TPR) repeat protein
LDAAEQVAAALGVPRTVVLDVVSRLVDRSLVLTEEDTTGEVRYRLLDAVREFATARLSERGVAETAQQAHAEWFAQRADHATIAQRGPEQPAMLRFIRVERANIDAALAWTRAHDPALGLRIAVGFGWSSVVAGEGSAGAARLREAASAAGGSASVADHIRVAAYIAWNESAGDVIVAGDAGRRALELAWGTGDCGLVSTAVFGLAFALIRSGEPRSALDHLTNWQAEYITPDPWEAAMGGVLEGYAALVAGDLVRARAARETAEPLLADIGDEWITSHVASIAGQLEQATGDPELAERELHRAVDAALRAGAGAAAGFHLIALGRLQQAVHAHETAIETLDRAVEMTLSVGLMRAGMLAQVRLGLSQLALGRDPDARSNLVAADTWFTASGGGEDAALASCLVAVMDCRDGALDAPSRLRSIVDAARTADQPEVEVLALDALAAHLAAAGTVDRAGELLAMADARVASAPARTSGADRLDVERTRQVVARATGS